MIMGKTTIEDIRKGLLFKDLSARLPYGVKMKVTLDLSYDTCYESVEQHCDFYATLYAINIDGEPTDILIHHEDERTSVYLNEQYRECPEILEDFVPCLRPASDMTEDEKQEYTRLCETGFRDSSGTPVCFDTDESLDYLNSIHVDHRGLIEKGLALAAQKGLYDETG